MKLPYTPLQVAALHAEEEGGLAAALGEMPVVCCSLHSQVAPVCAGIGEGVRVAYLQLPGGALPVSLSDTVRALKERGLVEVAVAVGACVDGDVACVSIASGLAWAAARGFSVVVCADRPGSSERAALWVTAGWPPRTRRTRRPHSAAARFLPFASRAPMPALGIRASPITRARFSTSAWARWCAPGPQVRALPRASSRTSTSTSAAGARRRAAYRSSTWVAVPTMIRRSSPRPTRPESLRGAGSRAGAPPPIQSSRTRATMMAK